MANWAERFCLPVPSWISDIKREVEEKVAGCKIAEACLTGERKFIKEFLVCYWPFVDVFPKIISRGAVRLLARELVRELNTKNIFEFSSLGVEILSEIRRDESSHRELWLKTAESVGLTYRDLNSSSYPEVTAISELVGEDSETYVMFLRFMAVEMVAEAVSKILLQSPSFKAVVGNEGRQWFDVHVTHENGMTHEELAFRLAMAFYAGEPAKDGINPIILEVVDLFVAAGNKACEKVWQ